MSNFDYPIELYHVSNILLHSLNAEEADSIGKVREELMKRHKDSKGDLYMYLATDFERIKELLCRHGYISVSIQNPDRVTLTDQGREAKRIGSIEGYLRRQNSKGRLEKYTGFTTYVLPIITILSLVVSILSYCNKSRVNKIDIRLDSTLLREHNIKLMYDSSKQSKDTNSHTNVP